MERSGALSPQSSEGSLADRGIYVGGVGTSCLGPAPFLGLGLL